MGLFMKGGPGIGKDRKGKELGQGLSQRKDGLYTDRFVTKTGYRRHISMHSLRHSFATRAIERGVNPKALQTLLGHASVQVTMGIYVHITDDSKWLAIAQFEGKSSVVTESTSNGVEPENKMV